MAKVTIIVSEMPKKDVDCPFAIECGNYPCVCDLKRDKDFDVHYGISFGMSQKSNCRLSVGKECDMLTAIN